MVFDLKGHYGGYYWGTGSANYIKKLTFLLVHARRTALGGVDSQSSREWLALDKGTDVNQLDETKARPSKLHAGQS